MFHVFFFFSAVKVAHRYPSLLGASGNMPSKVPVGFVGLFIGKMRVCLAHDRVWKMTAAVFVIMLLICSAFVFSLLYRAAEV